MRTLVILLSFITVLSCSDDKDTAIVPGEFRGELSGAVERKITADASFSILSDTLDYEKHLFLRFRTGQINLSDDFPPIPTGIFLSVEWDESSGVFNIENSSFSQTSFINALTVLEANSGIITIENYDGNILEGSININATSAYSSNTNNAVKIIGEFIATLGAPVTIN